MGAVNSHAVLLAQVMNDSTFTPPLPEPLTYAVACSVDIVPSIAFSLVNYSRLALQDGRDFRTPTSYSGTTFIVNGTGQLCTPFPTQSSSILTNYTLAVGAVAHQKLLSENSYRDGWWETIYDTADSVSGSYTTRDDLNFNNSQNPLEDALGLVSGVVLGAYFGSPSALLLTGSVAIDGIRIGTGQWLALLYIIPELYATLFILYFICIRKKRPASGNTVTSTS
jgi:hypothetical protein